MHQQATWKKWPQCPWSPYLLHWDLLSHTALMVSWGFSVISSQGRGWPGHGLLMVLCDVQTPSGSGELALLPLSGTSLKDSGEGKSSELVELWIVHLVVHLPQRKNGLICDYITVCGLWPMVWLNGQGLWKNLTRKLMTKFVEEIYGYI